MDYSKWFLQSKTIIGAVLIAVSMIAPVLGVDFSKEDADGLVSAWGGFVDAAVQIIGLILVVWGRFTATTSLTMLRSNANKLNAPWFITMVAVVLALAACSTTALDGKTPLEKLRLTYDSASMQLDIYASLPPCEGGVALLCSDAEKVEEFRGYQQTALGYLQLAEAAAADPAADQEAAEIAAQNAVRKLLTILAIQALTKV